MDYCRLYVDVHWFVMMVVAIIHMRMIVVMFVVVMMLVALLTCTIGIVNVQVLMADRAQFYFFVTFMMIILRRALFENLMHVLVLAVVRFFVRKRCVCVGLGLLVVMVVRVLVVGVRMGVSAAIVVVRVVMAAVVVAVWPEDGCDVVKHAVVTMVAAVPKNDQAEYVAEEADNGSDEHDRRVNFKLVTSNAHARTLEGLDNQPAYQ